MIITTTSPCWSSALSHPLPSIRYLVTFCYNLPVATAEEECKPLHAMCHCNHNLLPTNLVKSHYLQCADCILQEWWKFNWRGRQYVIWFIRVRARLPFLLQDASFNGYIIYHFYALQHSQWLLLYLSASDQLCSQSPPSYIFIEHHLCVCVCVDNDIAVCHNAVG